MSRLSKADLEKIVKQVTLSFLSEADAPKAKVQSKTEKFAGEAKLVRDLKAHYEDYEGAELAEASREKFGKANLRCCMLTWGILHKQPSVKEFIGNRKSKFLRNTWWNTK